MLNVCAKDEEAIPPGASAYSLKQHPSHYFPLTSDPLLLFHTLGLMHPSQYDWIVPWNPFGHTVRFLTGNKVLQYPEESIYFEIPAGHSISDSFVTSHRDENPSQDAYLTSPGIDEKTEGHGRTESPEAFHNSHLTSEKAHTIVPSVWKMEPFW